MVKNYVNGGIMKKPEKRYPTNALDITERHFNHVWNYAYDEWEKYHKQEITRQNLVLADKCDELDKICKSHKQDLKEARIEELDKSYQKSEEQECAWFDGVPTNWRTEWETIADHHKRIYDRIAKLKKEQ